MRDYRDAKAMAKSLRQALTARAIAITHSESLELIARSFGFDNWNILAARIAESRLPAAPNACSFCGKRQGDVRKLFAGQDSLICDECVLLSFRLVRADHLDRRRKEPANLP